MSTPRAAQRRSTARPAATRSGRCAWPNVSAESALVAPSRAPVCPCLQCVPEGDKLAKYWPKHVVDGSLQYTRKIIILFGKPGVCSTLPASVALRGAAADSAPPLIRPRIRWPHSPATHSPATGVTRACSMRVRHHGSTRVVVGHGGGVRGRGGKGVDSARPHR